MPKCFHNAHKTRSLLPGSQISSLLSSKHHHLISLCSNVSFYADDNLGFNYTQRPKIYYEVPHRSECMSSNWQIFPGLEMFFQKSTNSSSSNINPMSKPWKDSDRYDLNLKNQIVCSPAPFILKTSSCFFYSCNQFSIFHKSVQTLLHCQQHVQRLYAILFIVCEHASL